MKKTVAIFGGLCAVILLIFQLQQWSFFAVGVSNEQLLMLSGALFLVIGIVFSRYFFVKTEQKRKMNAQSSLSEQELRVLHLLSDGRSNKEIAEELYIAETTVKTHVSRILAKLDARRRTEAVKIGRELQIIS